MCCISTHGHIICLHLCQARKLGIESDHIFSESHTECVDFFESILDHDSSTLTDSAEDLITKRREERPDGSTSEGSIDVCDTIFSNELDLV